MKETSSPACVNCQSSQSDKSGTCVCKECNELFATEENPIGITPFATDISILPIKAENNKSSMTAHKSSVCDNVRFDDNQKSTDPSNPLETDDEDINPSENKVVEKRLRIFSHNKTDYKEDKCTFGLSHSKNKLKLKARCFSSNTVLEESWIDSHLTAIHLLRITKNTFNTFPFINSSYGKDVTKITFEGPCSTKAVVSALEYFEKTPVVEFRSEFFTYKEFVEDKLPTLAFLNNYKSPLKIESLKINCDVKEHNKLPESEQKPINSKIVFLLQLAVDRIHNLKYCNLSLPKTREIDEKLADFILRMSCKGEKRVDYAKKQVTYKADSSKTSSRKRNRESPEIEITQILTKEDKIESVTLSSDSEKDDTDDDEAQIDLSLLEKHSGSFTTAQDSADLNSNRSMSPTLQVPYYSTPEGAIDLLSKPLWRESNPDRWDSFDCKVIRVGDNKYKLPMYTYETMIFSDVGIFFKFPFFTQKYQFVTVGIPFKDIIETSVMFGETQSSIFIKTERSFSFWIRTILGMTKGPKDGGFYCPFVGHHCQKYIVFATAASSLKTQEAFKSMFSSTLEELNNPRCQFLYDQIQCRHNYTRLPTKKELKKMKLEKNKKGKAARLAVKATKVKEQTHITNLEGSLPTDSFTRREVLPNRPNLNHTGQTIPPKTTSFYDNNIINPQLPRVPSGFANLDFPEENNQSVSYNSFWPNSRMHFSERAQYLMSQMHGSLLHCNRDSNITSNAGQVYEELNSSVSCERLQPQPTKVVSEPISPPGWKDPRKLSA